MHEDTTNDFPEKADANFSDFKQVDDVGMNVNKPYVFLELCAGSASLSAEVKKLGLEVFAFDMIPTGIKRSAKSSAWTSVNPMQLTGFLQ